MKGAIKYFVIWLFVTVAVMVMVYIIGFIAMEIAGIGIGDPEKAVMNPWLFSGALLAADLVLLLLFWKRRYTRNWIKYGYTYDEKFSSGKLALCCVLGAIGCLYLSVMAQEYLPVPVDTETEEFLAMLLNNPVGILSACLIGPLAEEAIFRGAIERRLLETKWNPWVAIVISSLLFAVAHGNFQQGITAIIMGCFLGWVYYRTHSIWPCFLIHAVNNTTAVVMAYATPETTDETLGLSLSMGIMLIVLGVAFIYLASKGIGKMTADRTRIPEPVDVEQPWPLNDESLAANAPAANQDVVTPPDFNPQD